MCVSGSQYVSGREEKGSAWSLSPARHYLALAFLFFHWEPSGLALIRCRKGFRGVQPTESFGTVAPRVNAR